MLRFQVIDHGIDHEQYFPGCGVAFTRYTDAATGIGDSPREAAEDALDQIVLMLSPEEARQFGPVEEACATLSDSDAEMLECSEDHHHYVSIRWTFAE